MNDWKKAIGKQRFRRNKASLYAYLKFLPMNYINDHSLLQADSLCGIDPYSRKISKSLAPLLMITISCTNINPNFFYAFNVDDDYNFRTALWVDARCRAYYGDVMSFDTTYKINRHGLPFASFVGVNHHGKSTLLGCALLGNEKIPCFKWVFTQWSNWRYGWFVLCRPLQRPTNVGFDLFQGKTSLVQFIHEYDNVLGNKERKKLKDDAANSNGVISCASNPAIERQFQHEYISDMFREVQTEFGKNGDCTIRAFAQEGDSVYVKVKEEKLVNEKTRIPTFYVLPRWSKNIKRKHTYIKSSHDVRRLDESHNLFRGLCANFFNVAQEFVTCDEEVAMLHAVLDDTRTKLTGYRAKMQSKSVADTHDSMAT
ncbi:hypothetical protein AHAS_Ahas20G0125000 [Arachis hypogaea]